MLGAIVFEARGFTIVIYNANTNCLCESIVCFREYSGLQKLFKCFTIIWVTKALQMFYYITICFHIMPTGLDPSNVLNLWSNILQSMMKLQKYWVICENSGLHFIVRWFFRVTYSSHMPYDCNGNLIFPESYMFWIFLI